MEVDSMHQCVFCGVDVPTERVEVAGKAYCMAEQCISKGSDFAEKYRLMLMPKQGFTYVTVDDPALKQGRSSGR
jgi:hypothetical protein